MRRSLIAAASLAALAAPVPILAQDADTPAYEGEQSAGFSDVTEQLSDPERQREIALMVRAVSEVLLDLPVAPLVEAMGEIAGEDAPSVAPGTTLRSLAPEASRVPEEIEQNLPRAMDAMSTMASAMEVMLPQLREMAERLEDALPQER